MSLIGRVHFGGEAVIVERSGKPMVAVIPIDLYRCIEVEREARFEVLDQLRRRLPNVPEDEVMRDVLAALEAGRDRTPV